MSKVQYWGVFLDPAERKKLLEHVTPKHSEVYADHMTIVFKPDEKQNKYMEQYHGQEVVLSANLRATDDKGDAVVVSGFEIFDGRTPHITISCAPGTKPVYSNELIQNSRLEPISSVLVRGKIGKVGWK